MFYYNIYVHNVIYLTKAAIRVARHVLTHSGPTSAAPTTSQQRCRCSGAIISPFMNWWSAHYIVALTLHCAIDITPNGRSRGIVPTVRRPSTSTCRGMDSKCTLNAMLVFLVCSLYNGHRCDN